MNVFNIKLNLDKNTRNRVDVVTIRQGDVNGTTIAASIYDHDDPADLSGITSAYVEFALPDGEHYYQARPPSTATSLRQSSTSGALRA